MSLSKATLNLLIQQAKTNRQAQYDLGIMYQKGKGVPKHERKAVLLFQKAAEQGHAEACHDLGMRHEEGKDILQNDRQAFEWYEKAAKQDHAEAQYKLGKMYANGKGVDKDAVTAYVWFNIAAANGHKQAATKRDGLSRDEEMNRRQIADAQDISQECFDSNYQDC